MYNADKTGAKNSFLLKFMTILDLLRMTSYRRDTSSSLAFLGPSGTRNQVNIISDTIPITLESILVN